MGSAMHAEVLAVHSEAAALQEALHGLEAAAPEPREDIEEELAECRSEFATSRLQIPDLSSSWKGECTLARMAMAREKRLAEQNAELSEQVAALKSEQAAALKKRIENEKSRALLPAQ